MTLLVSFWFLFYFVLFTFGTYLWPVLTKNARKAFVHTTRINCLVTTLFEVFNRLEAFLFYPFLGNQRGTQKKTHFALFGSRSEHRFSCSLGNWVNVLTKVKILTPEPRWLRFLDHEWKRNLGNDTINYSGFIKNLERPST